VTDSSASQTVLNHCMNICATQLFNLWPFSGNL